MEQEKRKVPSSWSKSGVKHENFSPMEKRIAKCGLCVVVPVAMLYALHLLFPDAREVAVVFANAGMLLLLLAASCILLKPAEAASNGARKAVGFGLRFIKNQRMVNKLTFVRTGATVRRGGLSRRTRVRSRAFRSHHTRSLSTNASKGSGDSDPGDPPELPPSVPRRPSVTTPFRQFQPNNTSIPWRAPVHGACSAFPCALDGVLEVA